MLDKCIGSIQRNDGTTRVLLPVYSISCGGRSNFLLDFKMANKNKVVCEFPGCRKI